MAKEKKDAGKLRYDLVPTSAERALAAVLTFGAAKYEADGWRAFAPNPEYRRRWLAAAQRHLAAFRRHHEARRDLASLPAPCWDPETGLSALWHLLCDVAFLIEQEEALCGRLADAEVERLVANAAATARAKSDVAGCENGCTGCKGGCHPRVGAMRNAGKDVPDPLTR